MVFKTLRHKNINNIGRVIQYVAQQSKTNSNCQTFRLIHNLRSDKLDQIANEFIDNDHYRKKRVRGTAFYHEVISFSTKDSVSLDVLLDFAYKYIELRADRALSYVVPHFDSHNAHIHCITSGVELASSKTLRMNNEQFEKLRYALEEYQINHYPDLTQSIVYTNKPKRHERHENIRSITKSQKYYQLKKRIGNIEKTKREVIHDQIHKLLKHYPDMMHFLDALEREGLQTYTYRNKIRGVLHDGRKYRFTSLGVDKEKIKELNQEQYRLQELNDLRGSIDINEQAFSNARELF